MLQIKTILPKHTIKWKKKQFDALGATQMTNQVINLSHLVVMGLTFPVKFQVIDLDDLDAIIGWIGRLKIMKWFSKTLAQ